MTERRRWFAGDGQPGDRTIEQQVRGLDSLREAIGGKSVLDLGCAEGLLAKKYLQWGAATVHGVEIIPAAVSIAKNVCDDAVDRGTAKFFVGSIADLDSIDGLEPEYSIVTALAVMHKVIDVERALLSAAARAKELLVIRNPPEHRHIIATPRQHGKRFDTRAILSQTHFLANVDVGWNNEWVGYFLSRAIYDGDIEPWTEH